MSTNQQEHPIRKITVNPEELHHPDIMSIRLHPLKSSWAIELTPHATIIEMSLLMHAYDCVAERTGPDTFLLRPRQRNRPCPQASDVEALFASHRKSARPRLRVIPSQTFPFNPCTCGAPGGYPHEPECGWWESGSGA